MKQLFYIIFSLVLLGCNSENAGNCFQTAGDIIKNEVEIPIFDKVVVHARIELIITQGDTQKVVIESGENLLNDITFEVIDNTLILKNYNTCNFIREYDNTKVYITVPNLTRIRNASEYPISSNGTLTFPTIQLVSIGDKEVYLPIGDFHLTIQNESLAISSNGNSNFYIKGTTTNLDLNFFDFCDSRFEGTALITQNINFSQISSNDMLIYPVKSLKGTIYSTGDVILFNTPELIEVDEISNHGKLIFK